MAGICCGINVSSAFIENYSTPSDQSKSQIQQLCGINHKNHYTLTLLKNKGRYIHFIIISEFICPDVQICYINNIFYFSLKHCYELNWK